MNVTQKYPPHSVTVLQSESSAHTLLHFLSLFGRGGGHLRSLSHYVSVFLILILRKTHITREIHSRLESYAHDSSGHMCTKVFKHSGYAGQRTSASCRHECACGHERVVSYVFLCVSMASRVLASSHKTQGWYCAVGSLCAKLLPLTLVQSPDVNIYCRH